MNKKYIGMAISLIGLFIMGYEMGTNSKTGEGNLSLTFIGLFIVFVGVFIVALMNKKNSKK